MAIINFDSMSSISSVIITAIIILPVAALIQVVVSWLKKYRIISRIPGPDGRWITGHMHIETLCADDRFAKSQEYLKLYPRIMKMWICAKPLVILTHPDTIKVFLKRAGPKPTGWGSAYRHGYPWLGDGLLLSSGTKWARNRRLLSPAFHFDILKPYFSIYNRSADVWLDKIEKFAETKSSFDLFPVNSLCTLDNILQCAFSFKSNCQVESQTNEYVNSVRQLTESWDYRNRHPADWSDFLFGLTRRGKEFQGCCDYVHKVAEEVMEKRRQALKSGENDEKKRYLDFLDILLTAKDEDGNGLNDQDTRNEVDTFLFEGHDTTASGLSWAMYCLAAHKDANERVRKEVDELFANKSNKDIDIADLNKLEYLSMFMKEVYRIYPPVPFIGRCSPEDVQIDGVVIPKHTDVLMNIINLHTNPAVWDRPMEFDPERFAAVNSSNRDSFSYIPFSAGPRNCIGQHFALHELKVLLARFVHRFDISLDPDHTIRKRFAAIYGSENGVRVFAKRR